MLFKKAVLMIHGFVGGTYDQEELANYLELNREFDVFQFTLPGHQRNLSKVDHLKWITASEEKIEWLINNGYNKIYLIGHSMGGVIASYLASKYKEVKKLVLAAPAFHYLNVVKDDLNVAESLKKAPKVIKDYGGDEIISRMLKLGPGAIREFMTLVKKYYTCPQKITCPVLIIQGKKDNLVPISSSEYVYNNIKSKVKKLVLVEELNHEVFTNEKKLKLYDIVQDFLKYYNLIGGIKNI